MLVVEDVHTSFIKKKWYNPSKFSYINYCKKLIEDINSRYPGIKKYNYSLNKYIYSIQNFESIISYKINRKLCKNNYEIRNGKKSTDPKEYRSKLDENSFLYKIARIATKKALQIKRLI